MLEFFKISQNKFEPKVDDSLERIQKQKQQSLIAKEKIRTSQINNPRLKDFDLEKMTKTKSKLR